MRDLSLRKESRSLMQIYRELNFTLTRSNTTTRSWFNLVSLWNHNWKNSEYIRRNSHNFPENSSSFLTTRPNFKSNLRRQFIQRILTWPNCQNNIPHNWNITRSWIESLMTRTDKTARELLSSKANSKWQRTNWKRLRETLPLLKKILGNHETRKKT